MYAKKSDCPECGRLFLDPAKKCKCGWKTENYNSDVQEIKKCFVVGCDEKEIEPFYQNIKFFTCRRHEEDWLLKNDAGNVRVRLILEMRELEKRNELNYAKNDFLKNEHFVEQK